MLDLSKKEDRETLAETIEADINQYCEEIYKKGFNRRLPASIMGWNCHRKIWYVFRWCKLEVLDGRTKRLHQVGNTAEPRFTEFLRAIGFEVIPHDPKTNKQWRMVSCNDHYAGMLDGMCKAPARYEISEDLVFLNEFKTSGTGSGFNSVADKGIRLAKPDHYAQMSQYGKHYQLRYGLYLIENKNDSDITIEIVPLDWNLGNQLEDQAQRLISAKYPPNKISENPAYWECKGCHFNGICHEKEPVEKNCRSCRNAIAVEAGEWFCNRHTGIIPKDFIPIGCNDYVSINGEE